ncbi:hypothetical protein SUGI_0228570 [Cryptomeria japonica]|nr:hypothetical protein SUGI_0228570 [Cryptomeria japonica]
MSTSKSICFQESQSFANVSQSHRSQQWRGEQLLARESTMQVKYNHTQPQAKAINKNQSNSKSLFLRCLKIQAHRNHHSSEHGKSPPNTSANESTRYITEPKSDPNKIRAGGNSSLRKILNRSQIASQQKADVKKKQ